MIITSEIIRILISTSIAFIVAMAMTPLLTHFLFRYRMGKQIRTEGAPVFAKMHSHKEGTPTMGGILVWLTALILALLFWFIAQIAPDWYPAKLNFLSRGQTYLPLGTLIFAALIGMADDMLGIMRIGPKGGGLQMRHRLILYTVIAAVAAWWFYFKLDWDVLHVPFAGDFNVGVWYLPIFVFIIVASAFSTNQTDGLDGLAGGILLIAFGALAVIAFSQGRMDLAAFCGVIIGALLAFLWFNIYPAKFFMGDTGSMSLGVTLGVIAMLTNSVLILPFIGIILVLESATTILQMASKRLFGKKIFISAPIHHHFEAIGWPETKVTMRFWIIAGVAAAIGLIIVFIDKSLVV